MRVGQSGGMLSAPNPFSTLTLAPTPSRIKMLAGLPLRLQRIYGSGRRLLDSLEKE